ncbi:REP-associated tyrosine transposase [Microbulbifer yueqingensis]|uniref:REP-associated tyrosine transposase n=1 Tax=Microbulbifer yueqingensis TaxID=658219 RepID=UPI000B816A8D
MPNQHLPPGHRSLRKGRVSIPGQVYLITATTHRRHPIFIDFSLARQACRCFQDPKLLEDTKMLAWVLMPDHAHWLIELGHAHALSELVKRLKSASALQVNRERRCRQAVWDRAFHDRALRKEESIVGAARYVVANPLRAGLARTTGEYPFWDASWLQV